MCSRNSNQPKFVAKYRIDTTRLKNYDYSTNGAYFITICTVNKQHFFGEIIAEKLQQTAAAKICIGCWLDLPKHYENCVLDEFVVMPNHVHGIIFIQNPKLTVETGLKPDFIVETGLKRDFIVETGLKPVSTEPIAGLKPDFAVETGLKPVSTRTGKQYSISEIIRGFKTFTAKEINRSQNTTGCRFWQTRFYDHVIRNEYALNRIREYILYNPRNWDDDNNNEQIFIDTLYGPKKQVKIER